MSRNSAAPKSKVNISPAGSPLIGISNGGREEELSITLKAQSNQTILTQLSQGIYPIDYAFAFFANGYLAHINELNSQGYRINWHEIESLLQHTSTIKPYIHQHIIDVGCADSKKAIAFLYGLFEQGWRSNPGKKIHYSGLDFSPQMLAQAQKRDDWRMLERYIQPQRLQGDMFESSIQNQIISSGPRTYLLLGGTINNMSQATLRDFLTKLEGLMQEGDTLIINTHSYEAEQKANSPQLRPHYNILWGQGRYRGEPWIIGPFGDEADGLVRLQKFTVEGIIDQYSTYELYKKEKENFMQQYKLANPHSEISEKQVWCKHEFDVASQCIQLKIILPGGEEYILSSTLLNEEYFFSRSNDAEYRNFLQQVYGSHQSQQFVLKPFQDRSQNPSNYQYQVIFDQVSPSLHISVKALTDDTLHIGDASLKVQAGQSFSVAPSIRYTDQQFRAILSDYTNLDIQESFPIEKEHTFLDTKYEIGRCYILKKQLVAGNR